MDYESDAKRKCALEFAILFVPRGNVHASMAVLIWEWVGFFFFWKQRDGQIFQIGASFRLDLLGTLLATPFTTDTHPIFSHISAPLIVYLPVCFSNIILGRKLQLGNGGRKLSLGIKLDLGAVRGSGMNSDAEHSCNYEDLSERNVI